MPWKVVKRGQDWVVIKIEDGTVVADGKHGNDRGAAIAHQRALYANAK